MKLYYIKQYISTVCVFHLQILFALVPPPKYLGGWPAFILSLAVIGFMTAIIGDLASLFGCLVDLNDSITAITLVALGTSMPDTFASKQAAVGEKTADSSVGNINGSNSVNVFLGLGLPWLMATIYHTSQVSSSLCSLLGHMHTTIVRVFYWIFHFSKDFEMLIG